MSDCPPAYRVNLIYFNDELVLSNDELVLSNDEQVPNDKNQYLIMMNFCLIIRKQT